MSHEDFLQPDELDALKAEVNAPPHRTSVSTEADDLRTIEMLIATQQQTDKAMVDLVASLEARLNLLSEAVGKTADGRRQQETAAEDSESRECEECQALVEIIADKNATIDHLKKRCDGASTEREHLRKACSELIKSNASKNNRNVIGIMVAFIAAIMIAFVFGQYTNEWKHQRQDPTTVTVQPESETLDVFVAREAGALTSDERRKLIAVTEKILAEQFDTPAAMREEFRFERLKAGLQSPGFEAFAERWAAKVEATKPEDSIAAMQSIYESLLRGLKIQAYSDFSGNPVEVFFHDDVSPSNVTASTADGDVSVLSDVLPEVDAAQAAKNIPPAQETQNIVDMVPQRRAFFRR